ncbi:Hypothetical protein SMAX5B_020430 [Scophthalmus maximus]|uniref:Uncharacterized protein n=1 Tax=Scophthalmus maximus TaxID=52904 RepID=A0A2U9CL40_SCOMX|nr:Hypothetical protein SMAX5B_020430 [Scophthalmus maximus]KAF0025142.1 hypothetical protein F2P81_022023 [Scophthalmus maximus]
MIITRSTNMSQTPHRYLKLLKVNPATFSNVMPQFAEALEELNLSAHNGPGLGFEMGNRSKGPVPCQADESGKRSGLG